MRGRRKEKEKLPSGITADYTASFLAAVDRSESPGTSNNPSNVSLLSGTVSSLAFSSYTTDGISLTQSDSSETSLNSLNNLPPQPGGKGLPVVPPRPPKRGILKGPRISIHKEASVSTDLEITINTSPSIVSIENNSTNGFYIINGQENSSHELLRNTLQNEVIAYQNVPLNGGAMNGQSDNYPGNNLLAITSTSPSADSLTDTTTNSSFATPPFSLSPVGESQGYSRWSRATNFEEIALPLPPVIKLTLPKPRILTIQRQPAPRTDFGFSLRRAMIVERNFDTHSSGQAIQMKAVIFAEPGTVVQHNNETGLLPGDRLLEVNGIPVDNKTREEIINLIKTSKDSVTVKVRHLLLLKHVPPEKKEGRHWYLLHFYLERKTIY